MGDQSLYRVTTSRFTKSRSKPHFLPLTMGQYLPSHDLSECAPTNTPHTLHLTTYASHHTPYIIDPEPYALYPTPYTLHHTPYTIHPCKQLQRLEEVVEARLLTPGHGVVPTRSRFVTVPATSFWTVTAVPKRARISGS